MYVHVVGFHPASDSPNAVGGFEWRFQREDALEVLRRFLEGDDEGTNLVLARIRVPFEPGDANGDVTDWIDSHLELIELPLQKEVPA